MARWKRRGRPRSTLEAAGRNGAADSPANRLRKHQDDTAPPIQFLAAAAPASCEKYHKYRITCSVDVRTGENILWDGLIKLLRVGIRIAAEAPLDISCIVYLMHDFLPQLTLVLASVTETDPASIEEKLGR
jgi:hypothetical protein